MFIDNQAILWLKNKDLKYTLVIGHRDGGLYKVTQKYIQSMIHSTFSPHEVAYEAWMYILTRIQSVY